MTSASPAIIGRVDRQGDGHAIYLGRHGSPKQAGTTLLRHYSDPEPIHRLIRLGAVARLEPAPEDSITYFHHRREPWRYCQPYPFQGGTQWFFANYWSPAPEWLYVWTPDGWLGSAAMPGPPPQSYYADSRELRSADPAWREWLRQTREFQMPQPLHSVISGYRAQQPGSGEGGNS